MRDWFCTIMEKFEKEDRRDNLRSGNGGEVRKMGKEPREMDDAINSAKKR